MKKPIRVSDSRLNNIKIATVGILAASLIFIRPSFADAQVPGRPAGGSAVRQAPVSVPRSAPTQAFNYQRPMPVPRLAAPMNRPAYSYQAPAHPVNQPNRPNQPSQPNRPNQQGGPNYNYSSSAYSYSYVYPYNSAYNYTYSFSAYNYSYPR